MKEKRGDFNFVTIFAIIAGVSILILSIYGVTKSGDTQKYQSDTTIAKQIEVFIDPLQTGFATSSSGEIDFHQKIKFKNRCESFTDFGGNRISVATLDTSRKSYGDFGSEIVVEDKYLFSDEQLETERLYTISKTFSYPYEVSDFIILIPDTKQYCLENAPEFIKISLGALKIPTISVENCSELNITQVCSSDNSCDISIEPMCLSTSCKTKYDYGIVKKEGVSVPFIGELVYAAIFSEEDNYYCNVDRLLYRTYLLSKLYTEKADILSARSCYTQIKPQLIEWTNSLLSSEDPEQMLDIYDQSMNLYNDNKAGGCKVWE